MIKKDIGFVLKRVNFRETSLIAALYTYKFGKIRGIFKGFHTSKKEFSSSLDVFSLNEFVFYPKKSEIWLVSHADLVLDYPFLRKNLLKAKAAGIFFSLVDKTTELWDSNRQVFTLLSSCLSLLGEEKESKILYIFLVKFLTACGFSPEFSHCLGCRLKIKNEKYFFSVSKGGLICKNCLSKAKDIRLISGQAARSFLYIQKTHFPLVYRLSLSLSCEREIFSILKEFYSYRFGFDAGLDMV